MIPAPAFDAGVSLDGKRVSQKVINQTLRHPLSVIRMQDRAAGMRILLMKLHTARIRLKICV